MRWLNRREKALLFALLAVSAGTYVLAYFDGRSGLVRWPLIGLVMQPSAVLFGLVFVAAGLSSGSKGRRLKQVIGRLLLVFAVLPVGPTPGRWIVDIYRWGCADHLKALAPQPLIDEVRQLAVKKLGDRDTTGPEFFRNAAAFGLPAAFGNSGWGLPSHITVSRGKEASRPAVHLEWGGPLTGHHALVITDEVIPPNGFPMYGGDHPDEPFSTATYIPWRAGIDSE